MVDTVRLDKDGYPIFIEPPRRSFILSMKPSNNADIDKLLEYRETWGLDDPNALRRAQHQYLSRFIADPNSPRYKDALRRLSEESNSRRVLLAHARRTYQNTEMVVAADGDMQKEAVYINDGDDPCDECLALGGLQETIAWFIANDSMPADRCLGGDNCKCTLQPVN